MAGLPIEDDPCPGDAVAQIHVHLRYGSGSRPVRQLKGSSALLSRQAKIKTVQFPLGKDELEFWSPQTKQWVEPSTFDV